MNNIWLFFARLLEMKSLMPFPANYFEKLVLLSVDTLTPWPDLLLSNS